jgi:hypothetical protein
MHTRNIMNLVYACLIVPGLVSPCACGSAGSGRASDSGATGGMTGAGASGEIPIVAAPGAAVPYQFGANSHGVAGGAFLAKANFGSDTVVLDTTSPNTVCLKGTVEKVPIPADGSHPPYSDYWGIELGFNLNQAADATKNPWTVPPNVVGFWFTVEGPTIPPMRFKTTPTGKDPAQEQDSCALVTSSSGLPTQVLFTNMFVQCWDGPQGTGTTDISKGLLDLGLQVAAATDTQYPIDFCLTRIGVISN